MIRLGLTLCFKREIDLRGGGLLDRLATLPFALNSPIENQRVAYLVDRLGLWLLYSEMK